VRGNAPAARGEGGEIRWSGDAGGGSGRRKGGDPWSGRRTGAEARRALTRRDVLRVQEPVGVGAAPPEPTACPCLHYHGLLFDQPAFCGWGCLEEIPCPIVVDAAGAR
jgi:hypothetical protein